jgi:purine-cytosine permease-like protein
VFHCAWAKQSTNLAVAMRAFVQAFGGLIGIGLIGIVFVAALMIADWFIVKRAKRSERNEDGPP